SWTKRIITRKGSERIAEYACKLAKRRKNRLTIVHKSNVLKSDKLFLDICRQTAAAHGVEYEDTLVDSMAYSLMMHPERYDVVVTTNLFGDILSDMCAALVGSLGLVPSANIGDKYAFFEPVHGSAPDIAGKRSEEHTSELQSRENLVCRLLLEKKKKIVNNYVISHNIK